MKVINNILFSLIISTTLGQDNGFGLITPDQLNDALLDVKNLIDVTLDDDGVKILIPGIVRLLFHECIDVCDGCINLDQSGNRKLNDTVAALESIYAGKWDEVMSRADFWSLAAKQAVDSGIEQNNDVYCVEEGANDKDCLMPKMFVKFRYGRESCATSPIHKHEVELPDSKWLNKKVKEFFKEKFNLTPNNAVALLGAHTLGRAGGVYEGSWEPKNIDGMNNDYYKNIMDGSLLWYQEDASNLTGNSNSIFQWRSKDRSAFALNVDMSLHKDLEIIDEETGECGCAYTQCKKAPGSMFGKYAAKKSTWVGHFSRQYSKVLTNNNDKLKKVKTGNKEN